MPNQELLNYIQKKLERNSSKEEIKEVLLSHGWEEKAIDEVFDYLNVPEKKPIEINEKFYQSFSKPIKEEKPVTKKPARKRFMILVFIMLLILGGASLAYYYINQPLVILSKALEKTLEIKSFEAENQIKITIDDQLLEQLNEDLEVKINKEYILNSRTSFDYQNLEDIKASLSLADENINTELVLINNDLYGKLNYFNFDLSFYGFNEITIQSIVNNWIKIGSYPLKDSISENEIRHKKIIESIKDREKLIKKIEKIAENSENYHYKIEIDKQELGNIIIESLYQEKLTEEELIEIKSFINQELNINNFEIWINKKDNLINQLLIDVKINKLQISSKQGGINVYQIINISNHNKPLLISEPQGFMTFEELLFHVFQPPQDIDIKNSMNQLRFIAEAYKMENNYYANKIINNTKCDKSLAKTFLENSTGGYELCEKIQISSPDNFIININNLTGDNAKYCIQKTLNSGYSWCIDSTNYANYGENCDNINFDCKNP